MSSSTSRSVPRSSCQSVNFSSSISILQDNAGVIVNPKGEMKGSAITGPVAKECVSRLPLRSIRTHPTFVETHNTIPVPFPISPIAGRLMAPYRCQRRYRRLSLRPADPFYYTCLVLSVCFNSILLRDTRWTGLSLACLVRIICINTGRSTILQYATMPAMTFLSRTSLLGSKTCRV